MKQSKTFMTALLMMLMMVSAVGAKAGNFFDTGSMSTHDKNQPIGWGAAVTGSEEENQVTVTTLDELTAALTGTDKKTIIVSGTITFPGLQTFESVKNKSIYGLPGAVFQNLTHSATVSESGIMMLKNCDNIIIRNLTFKAAGAYDIDGNDNLTLTHSTNIWVDHCDFQDGVDGNLDCNNGSDNICVSWCRFRYLITPWSGGSGGSNDHRFSNLWGGGDKNAANDEGKLNTTFVNCWWDNGCKQRMPRVRFGKVHILNCLYDSNSAEICIGAGYRCNIYAEKNVFAHGTAWQNYATASGYTDYNIKLVSNSGAADAEQSSGNIEQYVPSYTYTAMEASAVSAAVTAANGAGATLQKSGAARKAVLSWQLGENGADATAANSITGATGSEAEGFTIAITGNTTKNWSNGNGLITYNSTSYKTLKNSNGAQNTVTLPTGMYAHKVEFYAVTNDDATNGKLSEFNGTSCSDVVNSLKDYSNPTYIAKEFTTGVNSFTFTFGTKQVCFIAVVTYSNSETLEEEEDLKPAESAEFADFSAIVNNQTGTLLTTEEQVQNTPVSFGVAVAENGTVSRVEVGDASSVATISGTYHSEHGLTGMKVVVPVPGKVTIQIGTCTFSSSKITVTNSDNEKVIEYTPTDNDKKCWKNNASNIIELLYEGDATTLTITGMGYCPFIAVKEYVEPAEFVDFSAIVNNQTGTLLTTEEQVQNTPVSFGVAVAENGTVSRVEVGDASSVATISGKYHSEHGLTGMSVVVPVPGKVTIQIGTCTFSSSKITVTNSDNEKVIEYTPTDDDKKCWKNDRNNIIELNYTGGATTLTITGMGYCPFIAVKKVKTAVEKSLYSTDFSEWSDFSASTTATNINKTTNFSKETLTFSVYNTALTSVTDENKFGTYTTLPHNALQANKAADPYVTTSKLANITKVRYIHGATGNSRGWKLEAKGDGDTDWVTISDSYANPSSWCEVTKDIKRTNCQLRFTNLNSSQNAYMFELEIFGEVELQTYEITGTITGGNIDGSTITLTGNGESYKATVTDGAFKMSVPAGTYTPSLSNDVAYLLNSPSSIEVTETGSIGTITIEAATAQTVSGAIANAPAEAFTLTFTGASHTETVNCEAGATSFTKDLMPDTYTMSSSVGTLSPLSQESFTVVTSAVSHNIYFPEAAVPNATQQNITVDNTLATATANNYKTVSDALAAAKAGGISSPIITLTSGQTYREQVIVDQANVTLKTSGEEKATITFYYGIGYSYYSLGTDGYYNKDRAMTRNNIKMIDPARWGATVLVRSTGNGFKAENIVFENSFNQYYTTEEVADGVRPNGVQSISYDRTLTSGETGYKAADTKAVTERAAAIGFENDPTGCELYNCVLRGSQDTFYTSGKIYVKKSNIIGNTDYIFGGGYVVFDDCDLTIGGYSDQNATAYITAYKDGNTLDASKRYVFRDCTVKKTDRTNVAANLGRDWGGAAASVYYFNLKNKIGSKLSYTWTNMGGGITAGTANLHIYDFDATINANYSKTGSTGANVNGVVSDADATTAYTEAVSKLGFTPTHIYDDMAFDENSAYNTIHMKAYNGGTGSVDLTRTLPANKWATIVLPFGLSEEQITSTFGADAKVAQLTGVNETALTFSSVTTMTANEPYMIFVPEGLSEAKTISGVTIADGTPEKTTASGIDFIGSYDALTDIPATDGSYTYYFVSNNNLYKTAASNTPNTIKAFRAYFKVPGTTAARLTGFVIDDETTSISEELRAKSEESATAPVYNLKGQRVSQPKSGIYIVDGKKVIVK